MELFFFKAMEQGGGLSWLLDCCVLIMKGRPRVRFPRFLIRCNKRQVRHHFANLFRKDATHLRCSDNDKRCVFSLFSKAKLNVHSIQQTFTHCLWKWQLRHPNEQVDPADPHHVTSD